MSASKPYTYHTHPQLPIVFTSLLEGFYFDTHYEQVYRELVSIFNSVEQPHYHVVDLDQTFFKLEEVILGTNKGARGDQAIFLHPNIQETIFVTTDNIFQMVAQGLQTATFNNIHVRVFASVEEALQYIVAKQAEQANPAQ